MIRPKAIIFKDRKCDWITKQRRVIISTHQSASIREEALQEALKVFPILTKIDDLRRIAKKFGFKTCATFPTLDTRMPECMIIDVESECKRKGLQKRKLEEVMGGGGNLAKRRKTVPCKICGIKRIPLEKWTSHFESKGHYRSVFRCN